MQDQRSTYGVNDLGRYTPDHDRRRPDSLGTGTAPSPGTVMSPRRAGIARVARYGLVAVLVFTGFVGLFFLAVAVSPALAMAIAVGLALFAHLAVPMPGRHPRTREEYAESLEEKRRAESDGLD